MSDGTWLTTAVRLTWLTPTLATLDLEESSCADQGGDNLEGVHALCAALGRSDYSGGLLSIAKECIDSCGKASAACSETWLRRNMYLDDIYVLTITLFELKGETSQVRARCPVATPQRFARATRRSCLGLGLCLGLS